MKKIVINHKLKVLPEFYDDVESGLKPFDVRIDDREPRYAVGDVLQLQEWNGEYTGRECFKRSTYVLRDERYCKPGYCVIGLAALRTAQEREKPLTLKELKQIYGEPVWFMRLDGNVCWGAEWRILDVRGEGHQFFRGNTQGEWLEDYGKTWLAYKWKCCNGHSRPEEG